MFSIFYIKNEFSFNLWGFILSFAKTIAIKYFSTQYEKQSTPLKHTSFVCLKISYNQPFKLNYILFSIQHFSLFMFPIDAIHQAKWLFMEETKNEENTGFFGGILQCTLLRASGSNPHSRDKTLNLNYTISLIRYLFAAPMLS